MKQNRVAAGLAAGLMALGLAACAPAPTRSPNPDASPSMTEEQLSEDPSPASEEPTTAGPSAPATSEAPSEEPSPSPEPGETESGGSSAGDLETDQAAAIEGWEEYQRLFEELASDPANADFSRVAEVAVGEEADAMTRDLTSFRSEGLELVENAEFRDIQAGDVETNDQGLPAVTLSYCADFTGFQLVSSESGEPFPFADGVLSETTVMVQGDDDAWRVASVRNQRADC